MAYTITLHFTSGERTYPVLREGYKLNTLVGAKGKHATQGCQLNIRSHEASGLILQEQAPRIRAELKKDNTLIFQGVIRPYQSVGAKNATLESFSLEILDDTEVLTLAKITETATYSTKSLSWCIGHIYDMADIPEELAVPAALEGVMLPYFIVSPDQYDNVASFLSALLFEFGYDYRFSGDQCRIIPTSIDDASGLPQASLRNSFKISREDNWTDGVKVNYGIAEICSQIPLAQWKEDIADLQAWRYILPWSYSDSSGHVTRTVPYNPFFSYPESSKPAGFKTEYILSVMNARADAQHCQILSLDPNPRSVAIEFSWNIRQNYVWGNPIADWPYITVYGDIVYAIPGTYQEQVEGEKPDEFTLTFLRNAEGAKAFAQREYKRAKCAPTTYTFQSLVEHEAGSFYRISDSVTGVNVVVRILTCALDADGIYSITAESADYINIAVDPEDLKMRDVLDVAAPVVLISDRDLINSGETVTVTASGRLMEIIQNQDPAAFIYAWTLNGEPVPAWDGLTEIFTDFDGLETGSNIIGFIVSRREGDQIIQIGSAQRELTKVVEGKDGAGAEIEYALGDSIVDPPEGEMLWSDDPMTWGLDPMAWNSGEYTEDVPDMERGRYIWMRTRVGDKDWQYTRLTGSTSWDPENLGVCTTACPTTSHDGLGLIPGDYFVAGAQFVDPVDGNTYEAGWAYTYDGSGWTELSLTTADAARKASALLDSLTTAGVQIPASNSQYSVWLWAKNFVSQNAVIDNLFSQKIVILGNGCIHSEYYNDDGTIKADVTTSGTGTSSSVLDAHLFLTKCGNNTGFFGWSYDSDSGLWVRGGDNPLGTNLTTAQLASEYGISVTVTSSAFNIHILLVHVTPNSGATNGFWLGANGELRCQAASISGKISADQFKFGSVDMKWGHFSYTNAGTYYIDLYANYGVEYGDLVTLSLGMVDIDPVKNNTISFSLGDTARGLQYEVTLITSGDVTVSYSRGYGGIELGLKVVLGSSHTNFPVKLAVQAYHG